MPIEKRKSRAIAVVPARSGSKGLPDKNIRQVGGRSLLEWAVLAGRSCTAIDEVIVSTDSPRYERIAVDAGASSYGLRPKTLSGDDAKTVDVLLDLLNKIDDVDRIVLLQPTSPIRTSKDIAACLEAIHGEWTAAISVSRVDEPHPYKLKLIDNSGELKAFVPGSSSEDPRQGLPPVYRLNGAIYAIDASALVASRSFFPEKTRAYEMPGPVVNIDCEDDILLLEFLLARQRVNLGEN